LPGKWVRRAYGARIGVLSSLVGVGGGQQPSLFTTVEGPPIHQAASTTPGLGVLIPIPGALGYTYAGWPRAADFPEVAVIQPPLALGFVSLIGVLLISPTSVLTAPLGERLAHALPKRKLEIAFGCFLLFISGRFLFDQISTYL